MTDELPGQSKPLAGVRVLDLTIALSGPYATLLLAGLGAEVIKIEAPAGSDLARANPPFAGAEGLHFGEMQPGDISISTLARHRGKRSLTLDLKSDAGRAIFYDLVKTADIVFENMSDGTADRLGLGYERLSKINPGIIYASIVGLGDPSPLPGVKAMDITVQALSGVMDATGALDGPPMRYGLAIADMLAPLYAVIAVQAALRQRETSGAGQKIHVSMLECLTSLAAFEHGDVLARFGFPPRSGNSHNRLAPFGVYRTRDGYVSIAAPSQPWMQAIFDALGRPELIEDPRFATRGARAMNADALNAVIEGWTITESSAAVVEALHTRRGVACVPVRTIAESLSDPWNYQTGALEKLVHPLYGPIDAAGGGVPIHMSGGALGFDRPTAVLGGDSETLLAGILGLTPERLAELKRDKVI